MPRYFELMDDRSSLARWHLGAPVDKYGQDLDPWQFKQGTPCELGCVPRFPIEVLGPSLDYCWAAFSIPVVHGRVTQSFDRLGIENVQFIPAQVDGHEGPYFILNALRIIPCIDEVRSRRVEIWKSEDNRPDKLGQYRVVSGMRIDPDKVGNARIFRPWGWRVALIVSEEIKQAMEGEHITGTRFVEVWPQQREERSTPTIRRTVWQRDGT